MPSPERHLFRNLSNPNELRRNPIVGHVFERVAAGSADNAYARLTEELRAVVTDAAAGLVMDATLAPERALRLHAIIARCDLDGVAHKIVAADLGICDRQFYRERSEATARVADRIRAWASKAIHREAPLVDAFNLELNRIDMLRQMARFRDARLLLDTTLEQHRDGPQRALALALGARISADLSEFDIAEALLDEARALDQGPTVCANLSFAGMMLADARGDIVGIERCARDAVELSRSTTLSGATRDFRSIEAHALLMLSLVCDVRGEDAATYLSEARNRIEAAEFPVAVTVEYFRRSLDHYVSRGHNEAVVVDAYARALAYAEQHGLMVAAARIIAIYGAYLALNGNVALARLHLNECLAMKALEGTQIYTDLLVATANAECLPGGDPAAGVAYAMQARARLTPGSHYWANTHFIEARCRVAMGMPEAAIAPATTGLATFCELGSERFAGASMRVLAQAHHAAGRMHEAKTAITGAIERLRDFGTPRELSLAYELSATIG